MKKAITSLFTLLILIALSVCILPGFPARADSVQVKPFLAFGADLTPKEKKAVMKLLGITQAELADYETVTVTNKEEHQYLDDYLASRVIGTRALSSVMIEEADAGSGIEVETHNISFCTEEMYTNALVTAGIKDAKVTVAGPFRLSGTAALVGAMKAYSAMTGEEIDSQKSDAATNELVVTGELGEEIGKEEAAQFVAALKDKVLSEDLSGEEEIEKAIDETAEQLNVSITPAMKNKMTSLMKKFDGLDLDISSIQSQAKGIYDKLSNLDIDMEDAKGVWDKIVEFFQKIIDWLTSLF